MLIKLIFLFFLIFSSNSYSTEEKESVEEETKKMCFEQNNYNKCTILGLLQMTKGNMQEATQSLKKACIEGKESCSLLGALYNEGMQKTNSNVKEAFKYYSLGCENSEGIGCRLSSLILYEGNYGIEKDIFKTVNLLKKGCLLNDKQSCTLLGLAYFEGLGLKKDNKKALELLKKSCDMPKNMEKDFSCNEAGIFYIKGIGVKEDVKKALDFFGKGCEQEEEEACKNYAKYLK